MVLAKSIDKPILFKYGDAASPSAGPARNSVIAGGNVLLGAKAGGPGEMVREIVGRLVLELIRENVSESTLCEFGSFS